MAVKTVAGPFRTNKEAQDTAASLGAQFSAFGVHRQDAEGFTLDECDYFVEMDDSIMPTRIFGYETSALLAKQYR